MRVIIGRSLVAFEIRCSNSLRYSAQVNYTSPLSKSTGFNITPEFSRSASRTLRFRTGDSQVVRFILTRLPTISPQKQDRIAYLVLYQNSFRQLSDESWENIETRKFLGQESSSHSNTVDNKTVFPGDDRTLEDFVAPWSLLQAASTDPTYLGETRYNFFTLIRLGNKYSRAEPVGPLDVTSFAVNTKELTALLEVVRSSQTFASTSR